MKVVSSGPLILVHIATWNAALPSAAKTHANGARGEKDRADDGCQSKTHNDHHSVPIIRGGPIDCKPSLQLISIDNHSTAFEA
jgi:hypothetical protein